VFLRLRLFGLAIKKLDPAGGVSGGFSSAEDLSHDQSGNSRYVNDDCPTGTGLLNENTLLAYQDLQSAYELASGCWVNITKNTQPGG